MSRHWLDHHRGCWRVNSYLSLTAKWPYLLMIAHLTSDRYIAARHVALGGTACLRLVTSSGDNDHRRHRTIIEWGTLCGHISLSTCSSVYIAALVVRINVSNCAVRACFSPLFIGFIVCTTRVSEPLLIILGD